MATKKLVRNFGIALANTLKNGWNITDTGSSDLEPKGHEISGVAIEETHRKYIELIT